MQIRRLEIHNFLRIRRLKLDLTETRVHLIAGLNEAGKTSLQEALRYCLLGETERVRKKGEYKLMVTDGAKDGTIKVVLDTGVYARDVATAKGTAEDIQVPVALQYLLDATRYPWINAKERRTFMFGLLGVTVNRKLVKEMMIDRDIPEHIADKILPLLRSGFDAAHGEAKSKATEARGEWAGVTGERYGSDKAANWTPPHQPLDENAIAEAKQAHLEARQAYDVAQQELGSFKGMPQGVMFDCPACETRLAYDRGQARVVSEDERGMSLQESTSRQRELETNVSKALSAMEAASVKVNQLERHLEFNEHSDQVQARALHYHEQVLAWVKAASALAPDGIPGEIIADKLKPVNERLRETAMQTGWGQVNLTPTMDILVDGRPFGLQSESSQWRAQAAIAEAISAVSEVGLLVLDRLDVLDIPNRSKLLKWIVGRSRDHNNVILIGTLKEPPKLPKSIALTWLEDGIDQEAAA